MNLLEIYRKVALIRAFENKLDDLFKRGLVKGTAHYCIGQEFIPVIVSQYLTDEDCATSTHRGHGHAISKGLDLKRLLAELIGKKAGYNCGRGGSQHVISDEHNFFANGITGGMVPVAAGMAFAAKYRKKNNVTVAYLGDGGFNEGYVQEALNLSKVLQLPILFVCENNQYAMSTPMKKTHSSDICMRVSGMGIRCASIADNDFLMLDDAANKFISSIRQKPEPYFIEVRTYRHHGHSKNDKNLYRAKEEEKCWFEKDVLLKLKEKILALKLATDAELKALDENAANELNRIADEVIALPANDPEDLARGVFA
jgi:acetoin:2,6-dichlorophenolindophenol oxidoreductase subunit alpha